MKKFLNQWRRTPEQIRSRQLLKQWRAGRAVVLPFLLRRLSHRLYLAGIAAAERNAVMGSWREARRRKRRISPPTRNASVMTALQREWRHCRRRCRVWRRRLQVRVFRWLLVNLLCLVLLLLWLWLWLVWLALPALLQCLSRGQPVCSKNRRGC